MTKQTGDVILVVEDDRDVLDATALVLTGTSKEGSI